MIIRFIKFIFFGKKKAVYNKTPLEKDEQIAFFEWLDKNHITHRAMVLYAFWFTFYIMAWCKNFAESKQGMDGMEIAAIISAITAPVAALNGWIFKVYSDRKNTITKYKDGDEDDHRYRNSTRRG